MKVDVLKPWENFRGVSYGNWAAAFTNWLFSADIDNYDGGDMLFLRGNVDYLAAGDDDDAPRRSDPDRIFSRTDRNGINIFEGTAVFVPIIASYYVIGDL